MQKITIQVSDKCIKFLQKIKEKYDLNDDEIGKLIGVFLSVPPEEDFFKIHMELAAKAYKELKKEIKSK